mmetsp:Transcript_14211/g.29080  ORF Transcript_14211/g.29080 Transcript_14211/m.29080 type:complete len:200 (-) Transcript_14211:407-1006(-)
MISFGNVILCCHNEWAFVALFPDQGRSLRIDLQTRHTCAIRATTGPLAPDIGRTPEDFRQLTSTKSKVAVEYGMVGSNLVCRCKRGCGAYNGCLLTERGHVKRYSPLSLGIIEYLNRGTSRTHQSRTIYAHCVGEKNTVFGCSYQIHCVQFHHAVVHFQSKITANICLHVHVSRYFAVRVHYPITRYLGVTKGLLNYHF